ncbi:MAG: chloride channel protein [Clostridia bacterium]|nr:chloride channel protein [Clostridia bacterium]MBQ4085959.1 chloride channel protein [Clostridia bacterium]
MNGARMKSSWQYVLALLRWLCTGALIGLLCGFVGALFAIAVDKATALHAAHNWLLFALPVAGLVIAEVYYVLRLPLSIGTDKIIATVRDQGKVPVQMAPAIFISTVLTHLCGGSSGREGAALQLGGSIGAAVGDLTHPDPHADTRRIFELCGMAALFSALFGTPITAAIFVLEIIEVGKFNDRALLPCVVSAVAANWMARVVGAPVEPFALAAGLAGVTPMSVLQTAGVGMACAVTAMLFCTAMHVSGRLQKKVFPNEFVRIAVGGLVVAALTIVLGSRDYNGGGMHTIFHALEGHARPEAFALKIIFTAITLGAGFKGGEIVPSFFVGSTMGCTVAGLLGLDPALGAALGLAGVFAGVTNAPLAAIMLSIELFGAEYLPLFGTCVAVAFMLSGHYSLYHEQRFAQSKLGHADENEQVHSH